MEILPPIVKVIVIEEVMKFVKIEGWSKVKFLSELKMAIKAI